MRVEEALICSRFGIVLLTCTFELLFLSQLFCLLERMCREMCPYFFFKRTLDTVRSLALCCMKQRGVWFCVVSNSAVSGSVLYQSARSLALCCINQRGVCLCVVSISAESGSVLYQSARSLALCCINQRGVWLCVVSNSVESGSVLYHKVPSLGGILCSICVP